MKRLYPTHNTVFNGRGWIQFKLLRQKRGFCVIDSMGEKQSRLQSDWQTSGAFKQGSVTEDSRRRLPQHGCFYFKLDLKKDLFDPPPARRLSSIHATIRVGKAEMLERALSLWMYVTPACPVTLSASDVFKQGRSGLQSQASSSDQAQPPICRLKRLCPLLSNSFFTISCSKLYSSRCVHF